MYNACCDEWIDIEDTDAYREERAFRLLKAGIKYHEVLSDISNRRHTSWYVAKIWQVASRQMRDLGDLWRFSTRSV